MGLGCLSGRAIARPFAFEFVHVVPAEAGTHLIFAFAWCSAKETLKQDQDGFRLDQPFGC
ncbi:hypothetical protein LUTEI9C_10191 [Luteimonas sp. 9C]|nr:hypothetical protein LUTEI9C_10191 [Luteimonas sp. 9C]